FVSSRRRHTRSKRDWSSDVCSSDLATAPIVLVQDADLEYDPNEYAVLVGPILAGKADVVFGSRFHGAGAHRVLYYWHSFGNRFQIGRASCRERVECSAGSATVAGER